MLRPRYMGSFDSIDGHAIRVEIWQETEIGWLASPGLTFPADSPLVIEWGEAAKHQPLCSSCADLTIESMSDRFFIDLYQTAPDTCQLRVYLDNEEYWRGYLDPEFYEEPFEATANYDVLLTFSDLGALQRKKCEWTGIVSLRDLVRDCLIAAGFDNPAIDDSLVSTTNGDGVNILDSAYVDSANFYDEEGEAADLLSALEMALQPLGLKIKQKAGKWWLFDLNGLHEAEAVQAEWSGNESTLSVDSVYNNLRISWSSYVRAGNLLPGDAWGDTPATPKNLTNINNTMPVQTGEASYISYPLAPQVCGESPTEAAAFTLWLKGASSPTWISKEPCKIFKEVPQNEGEDKQGAALVWAAWQAWEHVSGGEVHADYVAHRVYGLSPAAMDAASLAPGAAEGGASWCVKTQEIPLRGISPADSAMAMLKVSLPMWLDNRMSPTMSASDTENINGCNFKGGLDAWGKRGHLNHVYMPVRICFRADSDGSVYVYRNDSVVLGSLNPQRWRPYSGYLSRSMGEWRRDVCIGHPSAWLDYCDKSLFDGKSLRTGLNDTTPMGAGWQTNRHAVNPGIVELTAQLDALQEGQLIPYPPYGGGKLWIEVLDRGWIACPKGVVLGQQGAWTWKWSSLDTYQRKFGNSYASPTHLLLADPTIEIVSADAFEPELNTDDTEFSFELNPAAKDELAISAIFGMGEEPVIGARGAYLDSAGGQLRAVARAGRIAPCFELLGGTLYSQYAARHDKLSGEQYCVYAGPAPRTEAAIEGKKFIAAAEVQDLAHGWGDVTLIELSPDEYSKEI